MNKRMDRFEFSEDPIPKGEDEREFDVADSRRHHNSGLAEVLLKKILLRQETISPEDALRGAMIEALAFLDIGAVNAARDTLKKALGL